MKLTFLVLAALVAFGASAAESGLVKKGLITCAGTIGDYRFNVYITASSGGTAITIDANDRGIHKVTKTDQRLSISSQDFINQHVRTAKYVGYDLSLEGDKGHLDIVGYHTGEFYELSQCRKEILLEGSES